MERVSKKAGLDRLAGLYLLHDTPKGRGVFTSRFIPKDTIIETCPILILGAAENKEYIQKTSLFHYTYNWPRQGSDGKYSTAQAVVFGLGSMFNHSRHHQNVGWSRLVDQQTIRYYALRDISVDEELCISYGDHLTFEDADDDAADTDPENENDLLANVDI